MGIETAIIGSVIGGALLSKATAPKFNAPAATPTPKAQATPTPQASSSQGLSNPQDKIRARAIGSRSLSYNQPKPSTGLNYAGKI